MINPTIFLVVLIKRVVAIMALRQWGIPMPQGPVAGYRTQWVYGSPHVFG